MAAKWIVRVLLLAFIFSPAISTITYVVGWMFFPWPFESEVAGRAWASLSVLGILEWLVLLAIAFGMLGFWAFDGGENT